MTMKTRITILSILALIATIHTGLAFSLDGFVPFDTRRDAIEGTRKFLTHFTNGGIEKACEVVWDKDIQIRREMITNYDKLRPYLPKIGKRTAEHFIGANTLGDFWVELGYIEVFQEAVMFVRISFARPTGTKWYVKDINYTIKADLSKLLDEIPGEYKRFVPSERDLP